METPLDGPARGLRRAGFTLIELLVVIAIIAVLIGLLLPAVQRVREAAARAKCSNNLKQFGLAIHAYQDTYARVPPSGNNWANDTGSWLVQTLPYMEQGSLYNIFKPSTSTDKTTGNDVNANMNTALGKPPQAQWPKLPYGLCPSDSGAPQPSCVSYVGSLGPQCVAGPCGYDPNAGWCRPEVSGLGGGLAGMGYTNSPDQGNDINPANIRGVFNKMGAKITFPSVTDGLSNTIFVGESIPSSHDHLVSGDWWNYNSGTSHCSTIVPINSRSGPNSPGCGSANAVQPTNNWNVSWGFRSNHTSGANFLFGDGSVKFISQSIDIRTYQLLGCRNDGQVVPSY